jgi:hypothetical protein
MHMWPNHRSDKDTPTSFVHGGEHIIQNSFVSITRDVGFHVLCKQTHVLQMPSLQTSWWGIVHNRWYLHLGKCSHYLSDSCGCCFATHFFSGNGCNDYNLGKGCVISWPMPWGWFHPFDNKNIWMFTPTCGRFPSSLCQHGMVSEGFGWSSSFDYTFIL